MTTIASVLENPDGCSLKRLAWAYGCAPKGSNEEHQLEAILRRRVAAAAVELADQCAKMHAEHRLDLRRIVQLADALRAAGIALPEGIPAPAEPPTMDEVREVVREAAHAWLWDARIGTASDRALWSDEIAARAAKELAGRVVVALDATGAIPLMDADPAVKAKALDQLQQECQQQTLESEVKLYAERRDRPLFTAGDMVKAFAAGVDYRRAGPRSDALTAAGARQWLEQECQRMTAASGAYLPPLVELVGLELRGDVLAYRLRLAGAAAEAALVEAGRQLRDTPPACTGLTARWCPRCGDCKCRDAEDPTVEMNDPGCPLHAPNSPHAEAQRPPPTPGRPTHLVVICREGTTEVTPFYELKPALEYSDAAGAQWSETYVAEVIKGPLV